MSTGDALELCDASPIVFRPSSESVEIELARPTRIVIPDKIPFVDPSRERDSRPDSFWVRLRVEREREDSTLLCFEHGHDGLRYSHAVGEAAACDAIDARVDGPAAGGVLVASRLSLDLESSTAAAVQESPALEWLPEVVDCRARTDATPAGGAAPGASRRASRGGSRSARPPAVPELAAEPDQQAVTATGTSGTDDGTTSDSGFTDGSGGGDEGGGSGCAPDPGAIAPDLDPTVTTSLHAAVRFLYEQEPLVQVDVAPSTITPTRASLVQGIVIDEGDLTLGCVEVSVVPPPAAVRRRSCSARRTIGQCSTCWAPPDVSIACAAGRGARTRSSRARCTTW